LFLGFPTFTTNWEVAHLALPWVCAPFWLSEVILT
jgi:hypothetical protein